MLSIVLDHFRIVELEFTQNRSRDFFDGFRGRAQPLDAVATHHIFGVGNFLCTIAQGSITATRTTFVANFRQTFGGNGKTEKLVTHRLQDLGQFASVKVFGNQRIVSGFDTELHGQVQARRRLTGAANTHKDHVGFVEPLIQLAVIVSERVVDSFDTTVISFLVGDHVASTHGVSRLHGDFFFKLLDERTEQVDTETIALIGENIFDFGVDESRKNDRTHAGGLIDFVDTFGDGMSLFNGVDEGHTMLVVFEIRELS